MFVIMVRELLIQLNFPYVQFPCVSMSDDQLFDLVWEAVYHLERIQKALTITADRASTNRLFLSFTIPMLPQMK